MTDRSDIDLPAQREALLARRVKLEELAQRSHEESRPVELDQTKVGRLSRMDALQNQAMAAATERRRLQELERITAALGRLDKGDYGYCLSCDEPIGVKRLENDPTTPICIACASGADDSR